MAVEAHDQDAQATTRVVERNIEALLAHRKQQEAALSWQERLAAKIAEFAGSMTFVWLHLVAYASWGIMNLGLVPGLAPFDPTFVVLAMIASVEAIFPSRRTGCRRRLIAGQTSTSRSACSPSTKSHG